MFLPDRKRSRPSVRLAILLAMALLALPLLSSACASRASETSGPGTSNSASAFPGTSGMSGGPSGPDSSATGTGSESVSTGTTGPDGSSQTGTSGTTSDPSASGIGTTGSSAGSQTTVDTSGGTSSTGSSGTGGPSGSDQPGTTGTTAPGTTQGTTPGSTGTTPGSTGTAPWTTQGTTTTWPSTTQATQPATTYTTSRPTTQATTQTTTQPTTQATTQPTTTQGGSGSFPVRNYGTFFRNEYGSNANIVNSDDGIVSLDVGSCPQGVVLIRLNTSDETKRWKAILKGPSGTYQYDLMKRNAFEGVPLQLGSGSYTLTAYEQVSGTSYTPRMAHTFSVSLASSLSPYTASSIIVNFSSSSPSTSRAATLVSGKTSQTARIEAIYLWVVQNISYDRVLASNITSGQIKSYIPNPDTTMSTRKGICYDYAALMAAMLRSQGIPTRLIMGQVPQGYHAWNEVYIAGTGWVVVASFNYWDVDGSAWVMFDSTFAAGGMSSQTILGVSRTKERTY